MLGLTSNFELELRSRTAALSIANEALRSWQISGDSAQAEAAALEAAKVFSLERKNWFASLEGDCSVSNSGAGSARVAVKVRGVIEIAQGPC